jgi:hypothetical protein
MCLAEKQPNASQALQVLDIVLREIPPDRYLLLLIANHVLLHCFSNGMSYNLSFYSSLGTLQLTNHFSFLRTLLLADHFSSKGTLRLVGHLTIVFPMMSEHDSMDRRLEMLTHSHIIFHRFAVFPQSIIYNGPHVSLCAASSQSCSWQ